MVWKAIQRSKTVWEVLQVQCLLLKSSLDHHPFFISQFLLSASAVSLPFAAAFCGRAGLIQEAYDIIKGMPVVPNAVVLRSFLGACRNQGWVPSLDVDFLAKLESELGANYVLTANVFSTCASWKDANDLRVTMKQKGLKKTPGCSWVEVQN
ncbi:hypothetical protein Fmac_004685 [Flemingia macrophylla]|uniref:Pentatricopeptide repeat-containing protein n=1 Tax=Flemingia macrophylla TaxID=520843 RepID=A0ABD1N8A8_9FABA